jgi:hypothetical protein
MHTVTGELDKHKLEASLRIYSGYFSILKGGWFGFHCKTPEDASLLLSSFWTYDGSSLMLKRWRLAFNPDTDYFQHRHLWVLLPGLPLHLWNEEALERSVTL